MARSTLSVTTAAGAKPVGAEDVGGTQTEYRETTQIGGAGAAELADVKNAAPAAAAYGVVTRPLLYDANGNPLSLIADRTADAGNSLKIGGLVTPNAGALPAVASIGNRNSIMVDEFGRVRVVANRPKLLGVYYFHSGRLTILAAAHAATAGFFWLINPVGSTVTLYLKKLRAQITPTAASAFTSAPRITIELTTFSGVPTGASIAYAKRASADAAPVSSVRTASTGLTLAAGAVIASWVVPAVLTAVGIAEPIEQRTVDQHDDDDLCILTAGQGIIVRQADAGSTSDTRLLTVDGEAEER
jgi:hypothetical protein